MGRAGHSHLLTLRHSPQQPQAWNSHPSRRHYLCMVMLGFPRQWLANAYTIQHPSPKMDLILGGERTKVRAPFGSWVYLALRTTEPCLCPGEGVISALSLRARALSSVTGTMDSAQPSRPLRWI